MGHGTVPVSPKYFAIVELLAADRLRYFHEKELVEHFGDQAKGLISGLVVAGLVECKQSAHHGDQFRIDPYWYQAYNK